MSQRIITAIAALLIVCVSTVQADMVFAAGHSDKPNLKDAMVEAARMAKEGLKGREPRLALVSVITRAKQVDLAPMFEFFPKEIISGSSNAAVITTDKVIDSGVGVLLLGGDVTVQTALAPLDAKGDTCGRELGTQLKPAAKADGMPQLCIMAGDCHHPKNNHIAKGILGVLGTELPVVGAAADGPKLVIHRGEIHANAAIAVLLRGDFCCGYGMAGSGARDAESMVALADESVRSATTENKPELLLLFDCAGRRRKLREHNAIEKEFAAIKQHAGDAVLFGFYGQGEVGKTSRSEASFGSGYHISTCSISIGGGKE